MKARLYQHSNTNFTFINTEEKVYGIIVDGKNCYSTYVGKGKGFADNIVGVFLKNIPMQIFKLVKQLNKKEKKK
jgi:hypothetical protein